MFTGIIETIGRLDAVEPAEGGARVRLGLDRLLQDLTPGESVAVNGVCLTVEPDPRPERLAFFMTRETLERSTLGRLRPGARVNLERALRTGDRLGGHFVLGHVDGVGRIRRLDPAGEGSILHVEYPRELEPCIAEKGSIAIDGISLTVVEVASDGFSVAVIPETWRTTNLSAATPGLPVNLEVDVLARYVLRALQAGVAPAGELTRRFLYEAGFET